MTRSLYGAVSHMRLDSSTPIHYDLTHKPRFCMASCVAGSVAFIHSHHHHIDRVCRQKHTIGKEKVIDIENELEVYIYSETKKKNQANNHTKHVADFSLFLLPLLSPSLRLHSAVCCLYFISSELSEKLLINNLDIVKKEQQSRECFISFSLSFLRCFFFCCLLSALTYHLSFRVSTI